MKTLLLGALLACGPKVPRSDVKVSGNLPVKTEAELAAEAEAREACLAACAGDDADCRSACREAHPIVQVEVVPDVLPIER